MRTHNKKTAQRRYHQKKIASPSACTHAALPPNKIVSPTQLLIHQNFPQQNIKSCNFLVLPTWFCLLVLLSNDYDTVLGKHTTQQTMTIKQKSEKPILFHMPPCSWFCIATNKQDPDLKAETPNPTSIHTRRKQQRFTAQQIHAK
jgi:hypothetical protein